MKFAHDSLKLKAIVVLALATGVGILSYRGIPGETVRRISEGPIRSREMVIRRRARKFSWGSFSLMRRTFRRPRANLAQSCHSQTAGFTYPESNDNLKKGIAEGAVSKRFGFRAVPTMAYSSFIAMGPPQYDPSLTAYVGGLFWDGRATDLANQATFPFQNPNEMNDLVHNMGSPALVVQLLQCTRGTPVHGSIRT